MLEVTLSTPVLYLFLFLSGLLWAGLGLAYKIADHQRCRTGSFSRVFMLNAGVICGIAALFDRQTVWGDGRLWVLALAAGLLFYLVILILMPTYRLGPPSVVWIVVNLGVLVPIFLSPLFHEPLYWYLDPLLFGLFILMLLAFQRGMAQASETNKASRWLFLAALLAVLITNGVLLTGPKLQHLLFGDHGRWAYLTVFYGISALFTLVVDLFRRDSLRPTAWEWKAGLLAGTSGAVGMVFFMLAMTLPAAVVYSINGGFSLLGGVVLTTLIYHERMNPMKFAGLLLGTLVLLGAVLREPLVKQLQRMPALHTMTAQPLTHHGQTSEKSAQ